MARVDSEQESGRNFPKILGPLMNKVIYLKKITQNLLGVVVQKVSSVG